MLGFNIVFTDKFDSTDFDIDRGTEISVDTRRDIVVDSLLADCVNAIEFLVCLCELTTLPVCLNDDAGDEPSSTFWSVADFVALESIMNRPTHDMSIGGSVHMTQQLNKMLQQKIDISSIGSLVTVNGFSSLSK